MTIIEKVLSENKIYRSSIGLLFSLHISYSHFSASHSSSLFIFRLVSSFYFFSSRFFYISPSYTLLLSLARAFVLSITSLHFCYDSSDSPPLHKLSSSTYHFTRGKFYRNERRNYRNFHLN